MRPLALLLLTACAAAPAQVPAPLADPAPDVVLTPFEPGLWLHTTTRDIAPWGTVISHGLVVQGPEGLVLVDTAWGEPATAQLLGLIHEQIGLPVRAAVLTDFHDDRAGGLATLHAAGVDVLTSQGVLDRLAPGAPATPVLEGARHEVALTLAGLPLTLLSPGGGHSHVNLAVWLPGHRTLFGGCLIRPGDTDSLGNTADADLQGWAPSVQWLIDRLPDAEHVVPSHGAPGGPELLTHTVAITSR